MLTPSTETVEMTALRSAWRTSTRRSGIPFDARCRHVLRLEYLEQARAQAADEDRRDPERDRQRGQEHRMQVADEPVAVAADREEPAEVEREDEAA